MFIALLVLTGTFTWLLIRGGRNQMSSPLSQLPEAPSHESFESSGLNDSLFDYPGAGDDNDSIANSTLNFQKIFAINLPSRLDRKDILILMAKESNITVTIVPGVHTVAENALPPPRTPGSLRAEEYAVWRVHANVWRRVIEEGLTTALILEDDNDWDVNLKEQMPRILNALNEITSTAPIDDGDGVVRGSQVAESWDVLYLGSCWEVVTATDSKNRRTVVPIPSDNENVASHNYNWVRPNIDKVLMIGRGDFAISWIIRSTNSASSTVFLHAMYACLRCNCTRCQKATLPYLIIS